MPKGVKENHLQCKAKSKQSGQQCKNSVINGAKTCRMHGGTAKTGRDAAAFRTGRYINSLPKRMIDRFNASLNDPKVLEQQRELALIETRIEDLVRRVDKGESHGFLKEVRTLLKRYRAAKEPDEGPDASALFDNLIQKVNHAEADYRAWNEVREWVKARVRIVESERKRQIQDKEIVTINELMILVSHFSEIILKHVKDDEEKRKITHDFAKLLNKHEAPSHRPKNEEELARN